MRRRPHSPRATAVGSPATRAMVRVLLSMGTVTAPARITAVWARARSMLRADRMSGTKYPPSAPTRIVLVSRPIAPQSPVTMPLTKAPVESLLPGSYIGVEVRSASFWSGVSRRRVPGSGEPR